MRGCACVLELHVGCCDLPVLVHWWLAICRHADARVNSHTHIYTFNRVACELCVRAYTVLHGFAGLEKQSEVSNRPATACHGPINDMKMQSPPEPL